ncbi:hypothetical protein M231_03477 [Tremella mesenterica]|uniref:Uncharacterized protein n=1 Tax=Tremella mesenterica TaxID=5217 RepID=A0A4V1M462_TREME|nr:uncharacterized protein TREMEDRAFT_70746 [Tremella mesenterica DSM 1558]EIW72542.1 hypothetical protein TREMEDRAFT_70746 [Tremella mesenterica DSM 1558]RXK39257.1 hypothetical protein M231_03477 [Tremella mesenterica]
MGYSGPTQPDPPSGDSAIIQYGYVPSLAMGIVGVILWLLVAGPHLLLLFTKRGTRSVHGLFFFSAIIEALGYGARLYSHTHIWSGMGFLIGVTLVQIGTILMTAALYKSVQRGLKYTPDGRRLSPMRPRSLITLFVILDVVWVLMQVGGQYLAAAAAGSDVTGDDPMFALGTSELIFLAGNVLQAITIIIFSVFVIVILRRSDRLLAKADPNLQYPFLKPLLVQILVSCAVFFIRLVMRIAEGAQGAYGFASTHEVFFGVFEFVPIFLFVVLWAIRPLYKFIFPLGHRHGEGAHTTEVDVVPPIPASSAGSAEAKV